MNKKKGLFRIVFSRATFIVLALAVQILILAAGFRFLSRYMVYLFGGLTLLSAIVVIYIINRRENPSFKLAWVVPVLVIPIFGTLLYLFFQLQMEGRMIDRRLKKNMMATEKWLEQDGEIMSRLETESQSCANLARYIKQSGHYPAYGNTKVKYYPLGDEMYPDMLDELRKAREFIFLEFFIVERGAMWNGILEILQQKVQEGVEVRFLYDGMCCLALLPYRYPKELEKKGIRAKMFSPIRPALSTYQNNRDHRKILVIDGHTAFTGGINLADEYINEKVRFGHWKDTGIMLKGDAVTSFTMMFLQMWNISESTEENYARYVRTGSETSSDSESRLGYVIPYGDSPLDEETVGEQVYLDILYQAQRYVHIMTPYLILDFELTQALTYAAKRGVEVVIIMPHIPDKLYAFLLAKSYYEELIRAGVEIYEYTPGFVHAKVFSSDDEKAVVGTINLDFRSLHLHFECAAYLYRCAAADEVERDFRETLRKCQRITLEDCKNLAWYQKLAGRVLRLVAPLM